MNPILPGSTIGVFGSGQLGRMLALAAAPMGYHTAVFGPEPHAPAYEVSRTNITAEYNDEAAIAAFAKQCDVITVEFENVPTRAVEIAAEYTRVRPGPSALYTCQNRGREKQFLIDHGLPRARTRTLAATDYENATTALSAVRNEFGGTVLVKTAGFGYDGKGQVLVDQQSGLAEAATMASTQDVVIEEFISLLSEFSVLIARGPDGHMRAFEPIVNEHAEQILATSFTGVSRFGVPNGARGDALQLVLELQSEAERIARHIAEAFSYVGLLAVEFFVSTDGRLAVNEIAPRTHNSGHLTIEACTVSQFAQQVRAICGLPLGDPAFVHAARMDNLLGNVWSAGEPAWSEWLSEPHTHVHLYGKASARPGRKMGHITRTAATLPSLV